MQETLPFCKKEKKRRMRILGACFLAGKLRHSKQMLLTEFQ